MNKEKEQKDFTKYYVEPHEKIKMVWQILRHHFY